MEHFSHPDRLLDLECTAELCAGCRFDINGPAFGCKACGFYLHKHCAELPQELWHPFHPKAPLKLKFSRPDRVVPLRHCCRFCKQRIHQPGFVYKCNGWCSSDECCGVRIHVDCVLLKPSMNHSYHKHPLVSVKERGGCVNCAACGARFGHKFGDTDLHFCQECGDIFHKECLDIPTQVKRDRHQHDLTLSVDPVPKDYEEKDYYCDECEEIRDVHAFSYACRDCNYICHIRCDLFENVKELEDEKEEQEYEMRMATAEQKLDNIKEKIELHQQGLRTSLREASQANAALQTLRLKIEMIRERRRKHCTA